MLRMLSLSRYLLLIVVIIIYSAPCLAKMNEIIIATEVWPPFRIADKTSEYQYSGIDLDLLKEVTKRLNVTFKIKHLPWARCLDFMKSGKADIITGLAYTPERAQYIRYSAIPYYVASPAFYLQKGKGHLIKKYEDLNPFTIGYSINSAYFEPFNSDKALKKFGVSTEVQLIKMLAYGHIDVIIGTDCNVEHDIAKLGLKNKIEKAHYIPDKKIELYIGISKKSEFSKRYDELNRIIKELVETGSVDKISKKYF
ncbi:MAG: amino acid ABC transporter substrate-binding protein [Deltaproteobacteria bacterium]|nr:amino acid ABC transporter substrate-binding protein [Deltaproteobacteria bacterium]